VGPVPTTRGGRYTRFFGEMTRNAVPGEGLPAINNSRAGSMEVQVFGTRKSADTRKALRFFAERRVKTHFVDLNERAASLGELTRFVQKFGLERLIDRESKRFADLGLSHARLSDQRWIEKLLDEPLLLRMPLVRSGNRLSVGAAEADWKTWIG
jgi:arsenate reductase (glutaredoxin)